MKRLKILVSAYTCSPLHGSEPSVGWNYVQAIARNHEVWVIVEEEKYRQEVQHYLEEHPQAGRSLHFHFIRKRRRRTLRKIWPPSYYWYYREWQRQAYVLATRLHEEVHFDLVHQLTMVGFREPGYLWKLDVPFVWGPIGGLGLFPWRFLGSVGLRGGFHHLARNLYNLAQRRWLRRPRQAATRHRNALIAATTETQRAIRRYWGVGSTVLSEVGQLPNLDLPVDGRAEGQALRVVWSGLHAPRKALPLLLKAMAGSAFRNNWQLHILGTGSLSDQWRAMAAVLGIENQCHWHGWMERQEALALMGSCHVCVITSLFDLNSTVTMEALSLGLPVVALDHCGFSNLITEQCGILIPVSRSADAISGFRAALEQLYTDERGRFEMAQAAWRRAGEYAWSDRVHVLDKLYGSLIS